MTRPLRIALGFVLIAPTVAYALATVAAFAALAGFAPAEPVARWFFGFTK